MRLVYSNASILFSPAVISVVTDPDLLADHSDGNSLAEHHLSLAKLVDDLHDLLKEGSPTERRAFIKSFIEEVRVTGVEAVLSYSMPILPEKVAIEKEGVLPTVQYGGRYCTKGRTFRLSFALNI